MNKSIKNQACVNDGGLSVYNTGWQFSKGKRKTQTGWVTIQKK